MFLFLLTACTKTLLESLPFEDFTIQGAGEINSLLEGVGLSKGLLKKPRFLNSSYEARQDYLHGSATNRRGGSRTAPATGAAFARHSGESRNPFVLPLIIIF